MHFAITLFEPGLVHAAGLDIDRNLLHQIGRLGHHIDPQAVQLQPNPLL